MIRSILVAASLIVVGQAAAQDKTGDAPDERCWLGSTTFSQGSTIRAGNNVMICSENAVWEEASNLNASGCLYDGELYSTGAIVPDGVKFEPKRECQLSGQWGEIN